jgi:hypothetical protein
MARKFSELEAKMSPERRGRINNEETDKDDKQNRLKAWQEFSYTIRTSDEILEGEPQRIRFRTPQEIEVL